MPKRPTGKKRKAATAKKRPSAAAPKTAAKAAAGDSAAEQVAVVAEPVAEAVAEPVAEPAPAPAPAPEPAPLPRPRGRRSVYAIAVLVLVLAGVIGYQAGAQARRGESHYLLLSALEIVRKADADVATVSAAVERGLPSDGGSQARSVEPARKRAAARLRDALALVSKAQPEIEDDDRPLAAAVRQSALGRLEMMQAAEELLPLQARAGGALASAESGWEHFTRAAELSAEAAERFNTHTRAGVSESTSLTARAESALASSSAEIGAASKLMPEAALAPVLRYVEARRALARDSRRVDAVWLSGRVEEANRMLAKLAAREAPLDADIRSLPKSAAVPVTATYARLAKESEAAYRAARLVATGGDSRLRDLASAQPSE